MFRCRTVVKPQPSAVKTSALESYVVATEDPLVAVKVKEETRRREKKKKKSRESTERASTSEATSKRKTSRHQRSDSTSTSGSDSDSESRSGRGHSRKQSDAGKFKELKDEELDLLWIVFNVGDAAHLLLWRGVIRKIANQLQKIADINLVKPEKEDHLLENDVARVEIEVVAREDLDHRNARELLKSLNEAEIPILRGVQGERRQGGREGVTLLQRHLEETMEKVTLKLEVILHERM
ncbi:hypothetical protein ANCDUO_08522 [Ancylostoma duodenale]|uniref:Uncharacterized protein n=1 Tax=Ancylostoma duodenale TaxID=51022 RepID=A0A0C2GJ30_9BILA|nr:hypothetical protein ANCDUO_08522 [Ancylostoma duodenale]